MLGIRAGGIQDLYYLYFYPLNVILQDCYMAWSLLCKCCAIRVLLDVNHLFGTGQQKGTFVRVLLDVRVAFGIPPPIEGRGGALGSFRADVRNL